MRKSRKERQIRAKAEHEHVAVHDPYWMRAHRDWRFLVVVFLMIAAMAIYVATANLAWQPRHSAPALVVGTEANR